VNSGRFAVTAVAVAAAFVTSVCQVQPDVEGDLASMLEELDHQPLVAPEDSPPQLRALGEALFFDMELSGNRDIACATCHLPENASVDGLDVAIGTGGVGAGVQRVAERRVVETTRNTTDLLNRGSAEWSALLWDARIEADRGNIHLVGGAELPGAEAIEELSTLLAAQAMLAPLDAAMRGEPGDVSANGRVNELAVRSTADSVWRALMQRLVSIEGYRTLFADAYPDAEPSELTFVHAAEAIAAYVSEAFFAGDTPWDRYLKGEDDPRLSHDAAGGALLFFGDAGCVACHSGALFTDQKPRSIATPPFFVESPAPGIDMGFDVDVGRMGVTSQESDRFAFRTPSLRNVVDTAPYGHSGTFADLESIIRHHIDPAASLREFGLSEVEDAFDLAQLEGQSLLHSLLASVDEDLDVPPLSNTEIRQIQAFLATLSDADAILGPDVPESVPSGLGVAP
jgi:cytochrome c peroxidase